ncbi:MAG: diguanylate cyclase [Lachnospiraceae bacterium]|nr:diguanylate cyclase [Lachnospiraceae bacterium]MEE1341160.1 diguanylate cyclase [Lachnospiraceae bacterium]
MRNEVFILIFFLLILLSCVCIGCLYYNRRALIGRRIFAVMLCMDVWMAFCVELSLWVKEPKHVVMCLLLQFPIQAFLPILQLIFVYTYCRKKQPFKWYQILLLCLVPGVTALACITNGSHHLFARAIIPMGNLPGGLLDYTGLYTLDNGLICNIYVIFCYIIWIWSLVALLKHYLNSAVLLRRNIAIFSLGVILPMLFSALLSLSGLDSELYGQVIAYVIGNVVMYAIAFESAPVRMDALMLEVVFHNTEDLVIALDKLGNVVFSNFYHKGIVAYEKKASFISYEVVLRDWLGILEYQESINGVELSLVVEGENRLYEVSDRLIAEDTGKQIGRLIMLKDITEARKREKEQEYLYTHDVLTGVYNREVLNREFKKLDEENIAFSIIVGNLNGFKLINDTWGFAVGDELLVETTNILKRFAGKEDSIFRLAGDEFAMVLRNKGIKEAKEVVDKIRVACDEYHDDKKNLSISFGFASKSFECYDSRSVFHEANDNMRRKKILESKSMRSSYVDSLIKALGQSSYETETHSGRTKIMAAWLGREMGLNEGEISRLELLSLLHDIGKLSIPDQILMKPSRLDDKEFEIMKGHTENGYKIALSSPELAQIADDILYHHERWDGTGYPSGLKGRQIPKLARIICIIDSVDVMLHSRVYKEPMSLKDTIAELRASAGSHFDPDIANLYADMLEKHGYIADEQMS